MVRAWLVGPGRSEDDVPARLRERVHAMQLRAYGLPEPDAGAFELADVHAPLLYVRGALDRPEVAAAAERFVRELPDAREAVVAGCAHLPTMERPDEVGRLLLDFLQPPGQG